jgi:phosphatidylserine decarboxylase
MNDQVFMTLMRVLPKSALSSLVGLATRAPAPARVHQAAMRLFARQYQVNLDEAEGSVGDYRTFGEFFTRKLKAGARAIDAAKEAVVSPVDGRVSQLGPIEGGRCLQAKGITYTVAQLLADARQALTFEGGSFVTLYLSPRDYHRIHAPVAGQVTGYSYVPGQFWPVNPASVRTKEALFAVNERLITYLDTAFGRLAMVAVGATCVARIHAAYDTVVTHSGAGPKSMVYPRSIPLEKGAEVGMFEMGSTVVLLFEKGRIRFEPHLAADVAVHMGERIAVGS